MRRSLRRAVIASALLALVGGAAGLSGCAAGKASIPTADDLSAVGVLPKGADPEALQRGRAILVTECGVCHRLFLPAEYSPEQWGGIVKRMAARASLSGDQAADLLLYLSSASRAGK
jgi:mono/diheme cytochrome c family protein